MNLSRQRAAVIVGALAFLVVIVITSWSGRPITLDSVLSTLIVGVSVGSIYAIAASGIVVTYTTSGIFNFAQGAIGMFMAFVYWELRVNRGIPAPIALFLTILVIAPALGALIERVLIRLIVDSSDSRIEPFKCSFAALNSSGVAPLCLILRISSSVRFSTRRKLRGAHAA